MCTDGQIELDLYMLFDVLMLRIGELDPLRPGPGVMMGDFDPWSTTAVIVVWLCLRLG